MADPISVRVDPERQPIVLTMGLGAVVVGQVFHEGMPGIYLCPADKPGLMDADATHEVEGKVVPQNAVLIRFASMEAVLNHLNTLNALMQRTEAALKDGPA